MDSTLLGASAAFGGMLLVCAFEVVRDRRRIAERQRLFAAAQLRATADEYADRANSSRNAPAARIKRAALNTLATELNQRARRLDGGAR